jgi:general secretion pathway protein K
VQVNKKTSMKPKLKQYNTKDRNGLVLIAVLWIVVVITVIAAILGRKSKLDSKVCLARMESVRCKWACRAGIERAIAILNEDERETDCLTDLWYDNYIDFNDIPLERCTFTVQINDEASKLNINTATREQLMGLPYMVEEIADAIIDWRDTDEMPGEVGVEGGYYENLPFGYLTRNGPFRTIRELLLVRGVTEDLFYGEDTNLNGRLDYNERDGQASPPNDNADDYLDQGWAGYLTCYSYDSGEAGTSQTTTQTTGQTTGTAEQTTGNTGQTSTGTAQTTGNTAQTTGNTGQTTGNTGQTTGTTQTTAKVNVNTASDIVLAALLGGGDDALRIAQEIIQYRETLMYGIEDISELVDQGVISDADFQMIQDYITVTSNVFSIRCFATAYRIIQNRQIPGATLQTEAVIDRGTSPYKILYWYQGASN